MTENSKKILDIVNESSEHLTAEEIYYKLIGTSSRMAMATVYNNLGHLSKEGLIKKLVLEDQPDRYDKTARHDHLICTKCGKITDLYLDDITEKIEQTSGIHIESYDLNVHYICDDCKQSNC